MSVTLFPLNTRWNSSFLHVCGIITRLSFVQSIVLQHLPSSRPPADWQYGKHRGWNLCHYFLASKFKKQWLVNTQEFACWTPFSILSKILFFFLLLTSTFISTKIDGHIILFRLCLHIYIFCNNKVLEMITKSYCFLDICMQNIDRMFSISVFVCFSGRGYQTSAWTARIFSGNQR